MEEIFQYSLITKGRSELKHGKAVVQKGGPLTAEKNKSVPILQSK